MVKQQKPVSMTLIPAIAMAAYTTFKVAAAAVNQKKKNRSANPLVRLLRTINFADALVSVITLQNTLIMVSTEGDPKAMLPLTAVSSGVVWAVILGLSVHSLLKSVKKPCRVPGGTPGQGVGRRPGAPKD